MTEETITQTNTLDKFSDEQLSQIVYSLEQEYPRLSRLPDFKLIGFTMKKSKTDQEVPIYAKTWYDHSRYNCKKLRELRKERGVGAKENKAFKRRQNTNMDEFVKFSQEFDAAPEVGREIVE
jgi:hypothetical protein